MGFWPGQHGRRRHIEIYTDESRSEVLLKWAPLRMQTERP
jgi:5-methyltetrahydrofolate--homocysteine methyltransferase